LWGLGTHSDSFTSEFSPNFNLKNMISTYTKDFLKETMTQVHQLLKSVFSKLPNFYDNIQFVAKNIEDCVFFLLYYPVCGQIWLKQFLADGHFGYITESLKETLLLGRSETTLSAEQPAPHHFPFNVSWIIGRSKMVVKCDKFFFNFLISHHRLTSQKRIEH